MDQHDDLKSEDQMEIMMMMQQMEKIPDFCCAYNGLSPPSDISSSSTETHCLETSAPLFMNNLPNLGPADPLLIPMMTSSNCNSRWRNSLVSCSGETDQEWEKQRSVGAMREMIFRMAVMQPIHIDPESVKPPKRRNVKISTDPQSVAARHRRERISERIRILQRLVPGGTKMDTASMLDEAIHYVKFLKTQVQSLERAAANNNNNNIRHPPIITPASTATATATTAVGFPLEMSTGTYVPMSKLPSPMPHNVEQFGDA